MACICKGGWVNTACRDHGVDQPDPETEIDRIRKENDR